MAIPPAVDPVAEAHVVARALARKGTWDSVKSTLPTLGWAVGAITVVAVGLQPVHQLKVLGTIAWIVGSSIGFGLLAFAAIEIARLGECSRALRELVRAHIYYETLVSDARDERDRAQLQVTELSQERALLRSTLSVVALGLKGQTGEKDGGES